MIITGLVISLAWMVYERVGQESGNYRDRVNRDLVVSDAQALLVRDIAQAHTVIQRNQGWLIQRLGQASIGWSYDDGGIYRQQAGRSDTFFLNLLDVETFWQGKPILLPGQMVDEVRLQLLFAGQSLTLAARKASGAKTRLAEEQP